MGMTIPNPSMTTTRVKDRIAICFRPFVFMSGSLVKHDASVDKHSSICYNQTISAHVNKNVNKEIDGRTNSLDSRNDGL